MALYYTEHNFASQNGGMFTDDMETLSQYVNYPEQDIDQDIFSACTDLPLIELRYKNYERGSMSLQNLFQQSENKLCGHNVFV